MSKKTSRARSKGAARLLCVEGLTLDLEKNQVTKGGDVRKLTPKQCRLLEVFMNNPKKVLSRKFLMREGWETDYMGDTRTLDVHIRWLREKIEDDPSHPLYLQTVRGVGYRFGAITKTPSVQCFAMRASTNMQECNTL